jgi:hypothetical protein
VIVDETAGLTPSRADRAPAAPDHRLASQRGEGDERDERDDEDLEGVAIHWLEAGEPNRAAAAFMHAGRAQLRRAGADAAARCAVRALLVGDAHREKPETLAARIRLLADALQSSRRIVERDVLAGFERHVTLPTGVAGSSSDRTLAHVALDRCLEALRASKKANIVAAGLACGARALASLSDFVAAKDLLAEAAAIADDKVRLRDVSYESAKVAQLADERGSVIDILTTTILPADRHERFELLTLLARATVIVGGREANARTLALIVRTEALAAELGGDPVLLARCAKSRAMSFLFAGDCAEAAEITEAAVAFARRAGLRDEECTNLHNVGDACVRRGEVDRARSALAESSAIAGEIGAEHLRMHNEVLLAYLDAKPARIEELVGDLEAKGDAWFALHSRYWLGRLLADGRDTRAPRELVRVQDMARKLRVQLVAEECERALAKLSFRPA